MAGRWTLNKLGVDSLWVSPLWGTQHTSRVPSESEQSAAFHHLKAQGQSSTGPQTCDQLSHTTTVTVPRLASQGWGHRQWALGEDFSLMEFSHFTRFTQIKYDVGTDVAGVCRSVDDCDWFTVCCQEGAVTSILQWEFVWGLAEDTKISLHFYPPPHWQRYIALHVQLSKYYFSRLLLFILPFLGSSLAFSVPTRACSRWAGWV